MTDTKELPRNLTSYDLLKAAAVIIMIIDHLGYYFFPDDLWFRAIGRIGFPVWFFLVGYARGRDFSPKLWIGGTMLVIASMIAGQSIFPLNALFTIIMIRLVLDFTMRVVTINVETLLLVTSVLIIAEIPSFLATEYGTQGLVTAMFGYMIRHRPTIKGINKETSLTQGFALITAISFIAVQQILFGFAIPQLALMGAGTLLICWILYRFSPVEFPSLTEKTPMPLRWAVRFMGSKTLEIYVAHLVLFKFLGVWLSPERFPFLHWTWVWGE